MLASLLARQLKTHCKQADWSFSVNARDGKRIIARAYKYHVKMELVADVSLSLTAATGRRPLSSLVFTKRAEKQEIGGEKTVHMDDVFGYIEIRVNAAQGPSDSKEQQSWVGWIVDHYQKLGFDTKMYFKSGGGSQVAGEVHGEVAGAIDLVLCPKETILLSDAPRKWHSTVQASVQAQLCGILENDALWRHDT